jgi:serine phosphatase RsbU (regulator of sigma subunit)
MESTTEFANQTGKGNFEAYYRPLSKDDSLGHALLKMRDGLSENERVLEQKVVERTEQVVKQKEEIEEKTKELEIIFKQVTDSIHYAKRIQEAILPPLNLVKTILPESFILYKPKDIVSGDFYWAAESEDGFLIACVDCTGHGVPGAFMSLIGKENLDKAVVKTNSPKQLLQELNKGVKKSLNQNGSNLNRDGMDAAIVRIENEENGISKVFYSGANRPIWIIKKAEGVLEEIKATKQAIGGFTPDDQEFVEHELLLKKGDSIFISTDGFADQFGSDKNKKMTTKRFKDLLHSVNAYNSMQQKQKLEKFFDDWKGAQEQLDDLLVIGIKI